MKNKQKKHLVVIVYLCICSLTGYSQTYIGFAAGTNLLKVSTSRPFFPIDHNSAWDNNSLAIEIYIEQYLSEKIKLTLQSGFTSKYHDVGHVLALNPITDIKYNLLNTSLFFNWIPLNHFSVNTGISMDHLSKLKGNFALTEDIFTRESNAKILGGLIGASYSYKSFRLKLQYFHAVKFKNNFGFREFFTEFNSLEILLGYEIKLFDKLRKKKGQITVVGWAYLQELEAAS